MFDKLVESDLTGADLRPRRRIFVASFIFVGLVFGTAVVLGIYAADYSLGTNSFDIAEMLAPVTATEPVEPEPETPRPRDRNTDTSDRTTRQINQARTDEPTIAPTEISVSRNQYLSRPTDAFIITKGPERTAAPAYESENGGGQIGSSSARDFRVSENDDENSKTPPPAPVKADKKPLTRSRGVVNGSAVDLPKPLYSAAAIAVRASGVVNVQVTIDETGNVISAKAVSGHILLRPAAEAAAWKARFSPTKLSDVPVKVTGVIVYNFVR